ncbi:uncharacterized protein [Rutidosis leptorrhynchoides]|uniref:uncharacterized protein n=1 Tax=Rutidosis leptorrhynchoides TaxID=125765 RepID=UPI003A99E95C
MDKAFKMLETLVDDSDDEKIVSFVNSLTQEEVDGEASSSRVPRSRIYIARDREDAAIRLYNDYFAESPVFPARYFKRRFQMSRELFLRIVEGISNFNSVVIPDYFMYFRERPDATGRQSLTILQKCTAAIRQMAYGTTPDLQHLRKPTAEDIARLYNFHAQKHGLPDGTAPPSPFEVNGRRYERGYYLGIGIYPD